MQHWTKNVNLNMPLTATSKRFARFLIWHWRKTKGKRLAATWQVYEAKI